MILAIVVCAYVCVFGTGEGAHDVCVWQVLVKIVAWPLFAVGDDILVTPLLQELP
jgi:hypothetical protein